MPLRGPAARGPLRSGRGSPLPRNSSLHDLRRTPHTQCPILGRVPGPDELLLPLDLRFVPASKYTPGFVLDVAPLVGSRTLDEDADFELAKIDLDVLSDLVRRKGGSGYVVTCSCGEPSCGGWERSQVVTAQGRVLVSVGADSGLRLLAMDAEAVLSAEALVERVGALLEETDLQEVHAERLTPVHWAVARGLPTLLRGLLQLGHDPNSRDRRGRSPLLLAASIGATEPTVRTLLQGGASPDLSDDEGWTPLHEAADRGTAWLVSELLRAGATPSLRTRSGETPLHRAAGSGDEASVCALVDAVDDTGPMDARGRTPLDVARDLNASSVILNVLRPASA